MRKLKKLLSLLVAAIMTLAMTIPAMAVTITGPENGHTYEVYQIFTGDYAAGTLSNVKYGTVSLGTVGDGVSSTDMATLEAVDATATDQEKLDTIMTLVDTTKLISTNAAATITNTDKTAAVASGYYLIKDEDASQKNKDDVYTLYLVKVVGENLTISPKGNKPTVTKHVKEDSNDAWQKYADAEIGQQVEFKLTGTLPTNLSDYEKPTGPANYFYQFNDTMTNMTYVDGSAKVTVNTESGTDITANFTVAWNGTTKKLTVTCDDLLAIVPKLTATDNVIVTYKATLDSTAVVGNDGNPNTIGLTYTNNPNLDSNPLSDDNKGKTPEETVYVFTYKLDTNKYDTNTNENLGNAQFVFYKVVSGTNYYAKLDENGKVASWVTAQPAVSSKTKAEAQKDGVLITDADGMTSVTGLDTTDEYFLKEIKAPSTSYSLLTNPISVVLSSTISETPAKITTLNVTPGAGATKVSATANTGLAVIKVGNTRNSSLPTTGGMGTKVFYIVGGTMMAGALALLALKKKMGKI